MGDPANITIRCGGEQVSLYTHWSGTEAPENLRRALARKLRWHDAPYLARIIFCEIIKGHEADETGFGIWPTASDREIVVDVDKQRVWSEEAGEAFGLNFHDYASLPSPAHWKAVLA